MLSEREQHLLKGIEQQIRAEDPHLASALTRLLPPRAGPWVRVGHDVVTVVGLLAAALCLALSVPGAAAAAAALAGMSFYLRPGRSARLVPRRWRRRRR